MLRGLQSINLNFLLGGVKMLEKQDTTLYCIECDEDTPHKIMYMNDKIKMIKCEQCGKTSGIDENKLYKVYSQETAKEILNKPLKLSQELRENRTKFLFSLPKRIISKPYRVIKEIFQLLDA